MSRPPKIYVANRNLTARGKKNNKKKTPTKKTPSYIPLCQTPTKYPEHINKTEDTFSKEEKTQWGWASFTKFQSLKHHL